MEFKNLSINMLPELIYIRRKLHEIPELGFSEYKTSQFIANYIENEIRIPCKMGIAETGVIALIEGSKDGETIAIRADMDGLPIVEETGLPFSSRDCKLMHACGHDGHLAILLGTAKLLSQYRSSLKGNIKFIFQPAEELGLGAKKMIEEGVLEKPKVDGIIGYHIWPELEKKVLGIKDGVIMVSGDMFEIEIIGKGGHGGKPCQTIDPTIIAGEVITALQTIVSREIDLMRNAAVLSIGTISAGTAFNIIPERVKITGTIRTTDERIQNIIVESIERIVGGITDAHKATFDFRYTKLFPLTINDKGLSKTSYEILTQQLGKDKVMWLDYPGTASEDFSYYSMKVPALYLFLGAKEANNPVDLHSPNFDFDEEVLSLGVEALSSLAWKLLNEDFFNCRS